MLKFDLEKISKQGQAMLNHNYTHTHTKPCNIYLVKVKNKNEKIEIFAICIKRILYIENFVVNLDI